MPRASLLLLALVALAAPNVLLAQAPALAPASPTKTPTLLITTADVMPEAVKNTPYTATLAASGGTAPYRWVIIGGGLPPGFKIDPDTGTITGQSAVPVTAFFTVRAQDASTPAIQGSKTLQFTVLKKAPKPPAQAQK